MSAMLPLWHFVGYPVMRKVLLDLRKMSVI
jgi:hypothetical protein